MREYSTISGIQRVQLGLLNYVIFRSNLDHATVVFWEGGLLWSIGNTSLQKLMTFYNSVVEMDERRNLVNSTLASAQPIRPGMYDTFVVTGAIWMRQNAAADHAKVKQNGTRLGAYIYDFIPLSNPEFCHPYLTERFSETISDLLIQIDFAFTISDYVGLELKRLRSNAGFPPIPVTTVLLAHAFAEDGHAGQWVAQTKALQAKEFVLCVGSLAAHKNHVYALQVWRLLLEQGIEPPTLVLAGKQGYGVDDLLNQLKTSHQLGGRVRIIENLNDSALSTLYANCLFTLFPSFVEGWGLPIGESLAHGKVCIASNTTSIHEVGGDFVNYIDPSYHLSVLA